MNSRVTLWTMEKMLNTMSDPSKSLTDAWQFDEDVEGFDADTLLSTIMTKGMTFEPLFTDPQFFYMMNGQWWNKWKRVFDRWFYAANFEYEPLWDRNGYETVHEDTTDEGTLDTATSDKEIIDRDTTDSKAIHEVMDDDTTFSKASASHEVVDEDTSGTLRAPGNSGTNGSTTENQVSAYDSSSYSPHDKSTTTTTRSEDTTGTRDVTTDGTLNENGSGTDDRTTDTTVNGRGTEDVTTTKTGTIGTETTGDKDFDRDYHSWGNWGISQTSQKLLMSEYEVRYWNLYEHMADIFLDEMTIGVY